MAPAKESSVFSRTIVNLFAGMADGAPQLPRLLRDEGYSIHSIERTFTVEPQKKVTAELILCSDSCGHTLLVDAKSGANLSTKQLDRYACITEKALRESAFTTRSSAKSHNVLFVGKETHRQRLLMGSAAVPSSVRVVSLALQPSSTPELDADSTVPDSQTESAQISGLKIIENKFVVASLDKAFHPILPVDWDLVPVNYLPVDHEAEDWEFAERLIPELLTKIQAGSSSVKIDELGNAVIGLWSYFVADYKKQMRGRLDRVIKQAAQTRFAAYISYGGKGFPRNEVRLQIPDKLKGKPAALRTALLRQARSFLEDLQSPQIAMIYDPNAFDV